MRSDDDAPLVVVIEDEPTQRGLLTRVLERDGYEVIAVGDGEIGLRAIVEHAPRPGAARPEPAAHRRLRDLPPAARSTR